MEETINRILGKVKERLDNASDIQDVTIEGYIEDFCRKIISICNRFEFPKELDYLAIRYAMNCTVFYKDGYGEGKKVVSSVSDNGQSVSYKDVGGLTSDDVDLDKYIEKNFNEISEYAYMRW